MKYIDEYKDKALVKKLAKAISSLNIPASLMEVCGTHTMAIWRSGIRSLLPKNVKLLSGPGCPVCVTGEEDIDAMIALADVKDSIVTTFGDMMRVPGTAGSLAKKKAQGADIRIVYSPLDAVSIAKANKSRPVIFLGVGFETTAPTIAATIIEAREKGLNNFFVYSAHKLIPPAIKAILNAGEVKVDGFLLPGHVSAIIGVKPYTFIAKDYGIPSVIAGFEPVDLMESIYQLLLRVKYQSRENVGIEYVRAVRPEGNPKAVAVMKEVFKTSTASWRGLGDIQKSGLEIRDKYERFDAKKMFRIRPVETKVNLACKCGEVLRGVKLPPDCRLFGKACTPFSPKGPCMVSTEGTCAAYYKYGNRKPKTGNRGKK